MIARLPHTELNAVLAIPRARPRARPRHSVTGGVVEALEQTILGCTTSARPRRRAESVRISARTLIVAGLVMTGLVCVTKMLEVPFTTADLTLIGGLRSPCRMRTQIIHLQFLISANIYDHRSDRDPMVAVKISVVMT